MAHGVCYICTLGKIEEEKGNIKFLIEHNMEESRALLQSIIDNFKSMIGTGLTHMNTTHKSPHTQYSYTCLIMIELLCINASCFYSKVNDFGW